MGEVKNLDDLRNLGTATSRLMESVARKQEVRSVSATGGEKGVKQARFDLIPTGPLEELAKHYGSGALKYANHQWRAGYEWSKSYAALQRHLTAFWSGEELDTCPADGTGCSSVTKDGEPFEHGVPGVSCYNHTGNHHMAAVAWHAFTLLEFKNRFPEYDDRFKPLENALESPSEEHTFKDGYVKREHKEPNPKCGFAGCINSHE